MHIGRLCVAFKLHGAHFSQIRWLAFFFIGRHKNHDSRHFHENVISTSNFYSHWQQEYHVAVRGFRALWQTAYARISPESLGYT